MARGLSRTDTCWRPGPLCKAHAAATCRGRWTWPPWQEAGTVARGAGRRAKDCGQGPGEARGAASMGRPRALSPRAEPAAAGGGSARADTRGQQMPPTREARGGHGHQRVWVPRRRRTEPRAPGISATRGPDAWRALGAGAFAIVQHSHGSEAAGRPARRRTCQARPRSPPKCRSANGHRGLRLTRVARTLCVTVKPQREDGPLEG